MSDIYNKLDLVISDNNEYEVCMIVNDIHVPFYDIKSINLVLECMYDTKPDRIIINGDMIDFYELSLFSKDPFRATNLQDEIDETVIILEKMRNLCPNARIDYIYGNHEARITKYLAAHPEISKLRSLTLESLLEFDRLNIFSHKSMLSQRDTYINIDDRLLVGHFDLARKNSAYTAKALVDKYNVSILQGHVHRLALYTKRTYNSSLIGIENGCLCDFKNVEYQKFPDWQQGFSMVHFPKDKNKEIMYQVVEIRDHTFTINGKIYS